MQMNEINLIVSEIWRNWQIQFFFWQHGSNVQHKSKYIQPCSKTENISSQHFSTLSSFASQALTFHSLCTLQNPLSSGSAVVSDLYLSFFFFFGGDVNRSKSVFCFIEKQQKQKWEHQSVHKRYPVLVWSCPERACWRSAHVLQVPKY